MHKLLLISGLCVSLATVPVLAATSSTPAPAPATPSNGLVCQIAKSGDFVHIQALNKGTADVAAGTSFAFTIVGPTKKTSETKTLKSALAAGKSVNVTNAIKAASVVSCTPAA